MSFLNSIENKSKKHESPFVHWEINQPLTEGQISEIVNADIDNPEKHSLNYDGTRAIDGGEGKFREGISSGGKALKFRCFITKENSKEFPNLLNFIKELQNKNTYKRISSLIDNLERRYLETDSDWKREEISQYQSETNCEKCKGLRLKDEALCIKINKLNISQITQFSIEDSQKWFVDLENVLTLKEKKMFKIVQAKVYL